MRNEAILRQEIRDTLGFVRGLIHHYSGLYSSEDLARDVLELCDDMIAAEDSCPRLQEARRIVEERCSRLAQATDRFARRDPAQIAATRAQAVAAIDLLQDAVFEWRKAHIPSPSSRQLLRRRSL